MAALLGPADDDEDFIGIDEANDKASIRRWG
jgi:hypothetical protein